MVCGECEIDPDDHSDHVDDCACCSPPLSAALERTVPMPKSSPVATSNVFAALQDDDDCDDEDEMLAALKRMTPSVQVGPKKSQKMRKGSSQVKGVDKVKIAHIADKVR